MAAPERRAREVKWFSMGDPSMSLSSRDESSFLPKRSRVPDVQFRMAVGHTDGVGKRNEKLETFSKSQPAGQLSRNGEKGASNPGDAYRYPPEIQISDECDPSNSSTATSPKGFVTDDVCNAVLKATFSTSLDELDTPTEAWKCIYHCVAELSHIIGHHGHHTTQNDPSHSGSTTLASSSSHKPAKAKRRMTDIHGGTGDGDDEDDVEENGQGANPNEASPKKKPKSCAGLSCPFWKRNPVRFNVRSHLNCATQTFSSISLLKRHVMNFHKRPARMPQVICAYYGEGFATQADLDGHLCAVSGDMCHVRAGGVPERALDPEDGISPEVGDRLRDRRAKRQVLDWTTLWKVLFPGDETVRGADPVIELDEVEVIFQNEFDTLPPAVRNRLQTAIEASCGRPAAAALAEVACYAFRGFFVGVAQENRTTLGPIIKAQGRNMRALPHPTENMMYPYSNASGHAQWSGFLPSPASGSLRRSSALEVFERTSTSTSSTSNTLSPSPAGASGTNRTSRWDEGIRGSWGTGAGQAPGTSPGEDPAYSDLCPCCSQFEGISCACLDTCDIGLDLNTPILDPSAPTGVRTSNQTPAL